MKIHEQRFLDAKLQPGTPEPLLHWSPRKTSSVGYQPWTVCDNNQLTQLGTRRAEIFWLNYPLQGDFKFSCEALAKGRTSADLSFGGVVVNILGRNKSNSISIGSILGTNQIVRRTATRTKNSRFQKLTVESVDGTVKYSLDDEPIYEEKLAGTYPWLFLYSQATDLAAWRNPVFESQPEIAQEVKLVIGDRIEGWNSGNETQINFRAEAEPKPKKSKDAEESEKLKPEDYDWHAKDGVLFGKANEEANKGADSLLSYVRPMANGDQFAYEFLYEPDKKMANPMIGSVVVGLSMARRLTNSMPAIRNSKKHRRSSMSLIPSMRSIQ